MHNYRNHTVRQTLVNIVLRIIALFEFVILNRPTKLPKMAMLVSIYFTTAKKVVSSGAQPDDHWIKSLKPVQLS